MSQTVIPTINSQTQNDSETLDKGVTAWFIKVMWEMLCANSLCIFEADIYIQKKIQRNLKQNSDFSAML